MKVDKIFRGLVFAQVLLGVVAFCIAERNVGMLLIAGSLTVLSRYVTEGPAGWSVPRWMLNLLAAAAICGLLLEIGWKRAYVIVAMGHFVMWLQIIQLYAPRRNRDYGQVLVLNLMLMVGASILSVSMFYGLLLGIYCILGLWTVLWFQLKSTADQVADANRLGAPPRGSVAGQARRPHVDPVVGTGYRWHLRLIALFIAVVCATVSAVAFVALPRGKDSFLAQYLKVPGLNVSKTGFSNQVSLAAGAASVTDNEPVLNMQVMLDGRPVQGDQHSWLLRGAALDYYDPRTHVWGRVETQDSTTRMSLINGQRLFDDSGADTVNQYQARITMRKNSPQALFAVMPLTYLASDQLDGITYSPIDHQISLNFTGSSTGFGTTGTTGTPLVAEAGSNASGLIYTIRWPAIESTLTVMPPVYDFGRRWSRQFPSFSFQPQRYARSWFIQRDRIAELVEQVIGQQGLSRDPQRSHSDDDPRIVQALADYLRREYHYALDHPATPAQQDPLIDFMFNHKTGHCELFAAALAAMCRSVNIPARLVTGYRVSEYNRVGGYYVVRESNAHAWCEVDLGPRLGWHTFDPTPPAQVAAEHDPGYSWLRSLRELHDYFEFHWLRSVVAYDPKIRNEVLQTISQSTRHTLSSDDNVIGSTVKFLRDLPRLWRLDRLNYSIAGFIMIVIGIALISLARTLIIRRNRLIALQLNCLPRRHRRGLSRKLRFYLLMLELLDRHGHQRPLWQSPRHFAENLVSFNAERFEPVLNLTDCFYEIRFGHRQPDEPRIRDNLRRLEQALAQR
ncbi:MAG: DUF3488 domain-containing protein [Phycisphaeraceae bacterium]|nr:DUF3488 domain-containing protein [Phycisphaeraceae bacterium]